jgi:transposase-like protein
VQYACSDYIDLLERGEIQISMSRRGNPYDNARAERFMRTLKEEEVHGNDYRDLEDARSRIGEFLEQVYNRQRLHSALRYLTPEEFEQASTAKESDGADGSGGKPRTGLPPLPQALEIPLSRLSWKRRGRMRKERKHYTSEEKVTILRRHLLDKIPVSDLCEELGLQPTVFYRWQKEFFENGASAFQSKQRPTRQVEEKQKRIEFLEKKVQTKDEVLAELMAEHIALKKSLGEL